MSEPRLIWPFLGVGVMLLAATAPTQWVLAQQADPLPTLVTSTIALLNTATPVAAIAAAYFASKQASEVARDRVAGHRLPSIKMALTAATLVRDEATRMNDRGPLDLERLSPYNRNNLPDLIGRFLKAQTQLVEHVKALYQCGEDEAASKLARFMYATELREPPDEAVIMLTEKHGRALNDGIAIRLLKANDLQERWYEINAAANAAIAQLMERVRYHQSP